jgi:hypothetical protein
MSVMGLAESGFTARLDPAHPATEASTSKPRAAILVAAATRIAAESTALPRMPNHFPVASSKPGEPKVRDQDV